MVICDSKFSYLR